MTKFSEIINDFLSVKSVTLRKLQSLLGMLNFTCSVITPAKAFSRRMYNLEKGVTKPYHHITLTKSVKQDLQVWKSFLQHYNNRTFFLDHIWTNSQQLSLYTDASTSIGFGALFHNRWFAGTWGPLPETIHINILELYPICVAFHLWGKSLSNRCINIISDNLSVVHVINNFTSKDNL